MTIERLNELKECADDISTWEERRDITALIDAEIARLATTQDDVARAIDTLKGFNATALAWATTYRSSPYEQDSADLIKRQVEDVYLAITALQAYRQPMTKFEAWKQGLTIGGEAEFRDHSGDVCNDCPARNYCDESRRNKNKECGEIFKEWGEQDADK